MAILATFLSGLLFGLGLVIAGMINPAKVLNFLDFTGTFDPSLAITLAVAVTVTAIGYRVVLRRQAPTMSNSFHLPDTDKIDSRLVIGAALFGVGWGLAGFCPGPAIEAAAIGVKPALVVMAAMLASMAVTRRLLNHQTPIHPKQVHSKRAHPKSRLAEPTHTSPETP